MLYIKVRALGGMTRNSIVVAFSVFIVVISVSLASAVDVAYIYRSSNQIDDNFVAAFNNMGFDIDFINENNLPNNFDQYDFIFLGDENFRNENDIPVNDFPSVIANSYHMDSWNFVNNGVNQLGANHPLSVEKDGTLIQVYTESEFYIGGPSIPYYYLGNRDKAEAIVQIAATQPVSSGIRFGDVIAYMGAGSKLVNGKTQKSKMCFFGITETDYWTDSARDLFEECVGIVLIECDSSSQCLSDSVSEPFCKNGHVFEEMSQFECENPGRSSSQCVEDVDDDLIEECEFGCSNGECIEAECGNGIIEDEQCDDGNNRDGDGCDSQCNFEIECSEDAECGTSGMKGAPYCQGDSIVREFEIFECKNAGTVNSFCSSREVIEVDECVEGCSGGECREIKCFGDLDCGGEGFVGQEFCSGDDVMKEFEFSICNNPGTLDSFCSDESEDRLIESCVDACTDGTCSDIECNFNSDCGVDGFAEEAYCSGEDVARVFKRFICENPETAQSSCSSEFETIILEECSQACRQGECTVEIECNEELDCGVDGFVEEPYCSEYDRVQLFRDFECNNPGTANSYCSSESVVELLEICNVMCVQGECVDIPCFEDSECEDYNSLTLDICVNPGNVNSHCTNVPLNCANDLDCGFTGYFGEEFCSEDDVFKNFQWAVCNNPGTVDSFCTVEIDSDEIYECDFACTEGACIRCDEDSDCDGSCINPGTVESYCTNGDEPECGDGYLDEGEECDDGNNGDGDGCSKWCELEDSGCDEDWECDDYDSLTYDQCINSGTYASRCVNTEINCATELDCGADGFVGHEFCVGDNLYENFQDFECLEQGTVMSACISNSDAQLIEECDYGCSEGACIVCEGLGCDEPKCGDSYLDEGEECDDGNNEDWDGCSEWCELEEIECEEDSDCGINEFVGEDYCSEYHDIVRDYMIYECRNGGTMESYCASWTEETIIGECEEMCKDAECLTYEECIE